MSPLLPSSSKDASAGSNSSRGRSSATDKMIISRSRMLCSPYFVTAALLMLAVLMLKHWSLLDAHKEISLRLEGLHGKLKTELVDEFLGAVVKEIKYISSVLPTAGATTWRISRVASEIGTSCYKRVEATKTLWSNS